MAGLRAVLLCAGASTRFGGDKLLAAPAALGEPIAVRAARHLIEGAGDALAVVRPGHAVLRRARHLPAPAA